VSDWTLYLIDLACAFSVGVGFGIGIGAWIAS